MKKTAIYIVMATLCFFFEAKAQTTSTTKYLNVGDKLPNIAITNILNARYKEARLSNFKGKLIILDFWSTWCASCVASFPELDSLQREFGSRMQVLLVNSKKEGDSERGVQIVINRTKSWSQLPFKLPVVLQDTAITAYFKFHSVPHCVWINPDGTVLAITEKDQVTAQNIAKVLAGEPVNLIQKKQ